MKKFLTSAALASGLALTAASGLAADSGNAPPPPKPNTGPACFWAREADNFSAPDDKTLYVRVGIHDVYRLTLFGNCLDISWVQHVGLATHGMSNICEGRNPDVDVIDREAGVGRERCPVSDVHKMTPEELAAVPKRDRP